MAWDLMSILGEALLPLLRKFANPAERLCWLHLLSALTLACLAYVVSSERSKGVGLVGYLFPKSVWLHRSARVDYAFVAITTIAWAAFVSPRLPEAEALAQWLVSTLDRSSDVSIFGASTGPGISIFYTVTLTLADDLRRYLMHRLFHASPVLWEFHKVHHSARVLTPATAYREHPLEMLFSSLTAALVIGAVTAAFVVAFPGGLTIVTILGANALRFAFDLLGSNLRHSHIWLRFGRLAEHVVISPAQHQIHHSRESRHHDRNFGYQFAVWDWVFGTLYVPQRREVLEFGLGPVDDDRLARVSDIYLRPFVAVYESRRTRDKSAQTRSIARASDQVEPTPSGARKSATQV